jgi:hypothetical protein
MMVRDGGSDGPIGHVVGIESGARGASSKIAPQGTWISLNDRRAGRVGR